MGIHGRIQQMPRKTGKKIVTFKDKRDQEYALIRELLDWQVGQNGNSGRTVTAAEIRILLRHIDWLAHRPENEERDVVIVYDSQTQGLSSNPFAAPYVNKDK
jgi:hypothetical protein